MGSTGMHMKYPRAGRFVDLPPFQEVVDLIVGDAICILVRPKRDKALQVGGRDFVDEFRWSAQMRCQGANPAFVQTRKRKDIGGAVAELGEEAHQCFDRMVRADDQPSGGTGERVLAIMR